MKTFKKINAWLHLWLGLISGIIVVIVSITGSIYVFEKEIKGIFEPWNYVEVQQKEFLAPTQLLAAAAPHMMDQKPTNIFYGPKGEAARVSSFDRKAGTYVNVYVNPYNGAVQKVESGSRGGRGKSKVKAEFDFFRFILNGHRALWLPYNIGRPIVGVGILIFIVLLISGIILWWPKRWNKSNINKSFKVKWKGSFKRVNYDLHNVLGFYSMVLLLIIALTGLIWSFQWVSKSIYWATSGGETLARGKNAAMSDSTLTGDFQLASVDKIWHQLSQKPNEGMYMTIPSKPADAIGVTVYLRAGTYYKTDNYFYDRISLQPLQGSGPYAGKYADADFADKLRRMNYDIHVGAILGIPGKIIAFIVSLISASLPITGFIIWWGKKKKSKSKAKSPKEKAKNKVIGEGELATATIIKPSAPRRVAYSRTSMK